LEIFTPFRKGEKPMFGMGKAFGAWFVFCAALGLGFLGVVVWAIVSLVTHFT
jgi:uncharacterized membrane protein